MKNSGKVLNLIIKVANEFNERLDIKIAVDSGAKAFLFGPQGALDSLGLVTFVAAVEQALEDEFNLTITLADEKAMSQRNSPFISIETLTLYVESLLKEAK